jgi:tRNA threonylcarbamoyladenosine biosynthesis protein TsaB
VILESSGRSGFVALAEGARLLGVRYLDEARRHARDLAPTLSELLAEIGWKPRDVEGILLSRGPGSYTGLRVAAMSAKMFAYATGCKLVSVDTFEAIVQGTPADIARVAVLADAQKEKVYVQQFACGRGQWHPESDLFVAPIREWLTGRTPDAWLTGPGLARWEAELLHDLPLVPAERRMPLPEGVLAVGLRRWGAGEHDDPFAFEPLYLRPSSAEEQWERRRQEHTRNP